MMMREPVNRRQLLPAELLRDLSEGIHGVLTASRRRDKSVRSQADWVAVWIAPILAELRADLADVELQLEQAGAALERAVADATRLADLAHDRHVVAQRLRGELAVALAQVDTAHAPATGRHARRDVAS